MFATIIVTHNSRKSSVESRKEQFLDQLLFIFYINDMCNVLKLLHIIIFADDTNMFYSISNIDDVNNVVNNELKQLGLWFRAKKISFNLNKANVIMFNNKTTT